ncbi:unnamed protein product, partial [Cylicostephanus goldi]
MHVHHFTVAVVKPFLRAKSTCRSYHRKTSQKPIKLEVDSDQSPERRDESPPRRREQPRGRERRIASPEKLGKESQKTLDGKIAGLQSADALKKESEKIREQESKMFEEMDATISGRFAETTVREKQVRKKREKPEDKERKEREAKKQAELQEKYDLWNKGVAQKER